MNRLISRLVLSALVSTMVCATTSAAIITAHLSGVSGGPNDFAGADAISSATAAAATGDEVQVTEAGTYSRVTFRGGKTYTVRGMVNGVTISGASGTNQTAASTSGTLAGPLDLTLIDLSFVNPVLSSGTTFLIQQHNTQRTTVTMQNCLVRSSATTGSLGQNAVQITGGSVANSGRVSLIATNSKFEQLTTGTGRNALNYSGTANALNNLQVRLTSCTLFSNLGAVVNWGANANAMIWDIQRCNLSSPVSGRQSGMNVDVVSNDTIVNIVDSKIQVPGEVIRMNNRACTGQKWLVNRSLLSNARGAVGMSFDSNTNFRLRYSTNTATPFNEVKLYNTVFIQHGRMRADLSNGAGAVESSANTSTTLIHCTVVKELPWAPTSGSNSALNAQGGQQTAANRPRAAAYNTAFVGLFNSVMEPGMKARGNLIANDNGTSVTLVADDVDAGADRTTATLGYLNGNPNTLLFSHNIPQTGSAAINKAHTSATLLAAIGYVDKNKAPRNLTAGTNPGQSPHDIGAYESYALGVPVEVSNFAID